MERVRFADCVLFTDVDPGLTPGPPHVLRIDKLNSAQDYSEFLLDRLVDYIHTDHCLVVQWDGFVLDADRWDPNFLSYDYIGAPWPQFNDGQDVGNGGFSLRSRKLLEACRDPRFERRHPEDVAICRVNRRLLEQEHGIKFAERALAERFSFERTVPSGATFGFHGVFNMIPAIGAERFWEIYRVLNDRRTVFVDYGQLMSQLGQGPNPLWRRVHLTLDRMNEAFSRPPTRRQAALRRSASLRD
jgi:hypothetical protein